MQLTWFGGEESPPPLPILPSLSRLRETVRNIPWACGWVPVLQMQSRELPGNNATLLPMKVG